MKISREILNEITIKSNRFGFEPEFTMEVTKRGLRIYEVPISYYGRTYAEGKNRLARWRESNFGSRFESPVTDLTWSTVEHEAATN